MGWHPIIKIMLNPLNFTTFNQAFNTYYLFNKTVNQNIMEIPESIKKKYNALWVTAMVLGTLLLIILLISFLPKIYSELFMEKSFIMDDWGWEGTVVIGMFIGYVIGYILVWWKRLIGAIVFLLTAILEMGIFLIVDGNTGSLIFGIPILVVGVLFLASNYIK